MRPRGFSLVELMVGLAIFAILVVLAVPTLSEFNANSQVRGASEAMLNGVRLAQAQAVRSNSPTTFTLSAAGWTVETKDPDDPGKTIFSESYAVAEGAKNATMAATPGDAVTVTFGGFGRVIPNDDGTTTLTQIDVGHATAASVRNLRVLIADANGGTRMCDPAMPSTDPQGCP